MILLLSTLLLVQDTGQAYSGRDHRITVRVPRAEAAAVVDGHLDEPVWSTAARLTGFSQYQPVDSRPAEEPTEVLVWYSPDAIWFGIRARELHGDVVRATRANRDNIGSEDQVQILLDTYNDHRLAYLFGVNPLGVQQDGTRSDQFGGGAGGGSATGGGVGLNFLDGNVDLNPDYAFESKGRLVEGGYEIEIRIPFKSLRYGSGAEQTWGINVLRRIQHTGYQDSWAPAVRGNASFLGQSGVITGLHDLHRGLVLEATPTATSHFDGAPGASGRWGYAGSGDLGGDLRWGLSQNMTLSGTANPDFSQVEADVGQVLLNERFALFYPEKRPFFLEGLERFDSPNQLIYTRRIADPDVGVKIAGKSGPTNLALIAALDADSTGGHPRVGALRLRRDLGRNSTIGLVATDREVAGDYGRLLGADATIYHSRLYFVQLQAVQSWTRSGGAATSGPLLQAVWDRTGRNWGFHYTLRGVAPDFDAALGFVNRTDVINVDIRNRLTGYGAPGAFIQTYTAFFGFGRFWEYAHPSGGSIEGGESVSPSATLRGGWQLNGNFGRNFYSFSPSSYADYTVRDAANDTVAFTTPPMERNDFAGSIGLTTPTFRMITASVNAAAGLVPIFLEAAPGRSTQLGATVDLRPTPAMRVSFNATRRVIHRRRDGSQFSSEAIPRLKLEYQLTRAIFFRFVGQYTVRELAALQDRNGNPILVRDTLATASSTRQFRMDWLFSYRPVPGTLVYLGYGSTLDAPDALTSRDLKRSSDGFFGKVSWLFRL